MKPFKKGFLVGALFGGVYALLHAPEEGKVTRQAILDYGKHLQNDVTAICQDTQDLLVAVNRLNQDAKRVTKRLASDVRDISERAQTETQPRLRKLSQALSQLQTNLEEFKK